MNRFVSASSIAVLGVLASVASYAAPAAAELSDRSKGTVWNLEHWVYMSDCRYDKPMPAEPDSYFVAACEHGYEQEERYLAMLTPAEKEDPRAKAAFEMHAKSAQYIVKVKAANGRELIEEKFAGQIDRTSAPPGRATPGSMSSSITADGTTRRSTMIVPSRSGPTHLDRSVHSPFGHAESPFQVHSQDLNERVTDLQLAVNRLHQDVSAIRQVVERMSPLSASLILGRTAGLK